MANSTLVVTDPSPIIVTFRADERYSTNWVLISLDEPIAFPISTETDSGKAVIFSAGQSLTSLDISGSLITVDGGDSADKQLFTQLLPLCKQSMGSFDSNDDPILATLTLQLGTGGVLTATGWVRNFVADRTAPEGLIEIKVTFNFLFNTDPNVSGLL